MIKPILAALTALAACGAVSAQEDPLRGYRIALIVYQGGQADAALRLAGSWRHEAVRSDARRLTEDRDLRLAPGVALLITELARRDTKAGGPDLFATADLLVGNLRPRSPDLRAFQERWYTFMTSLFIDELNPYGGRRLIDRALRVVGESSRLQLLSGILFEVATYPHATCPISDCRMSEEQRLRTLAQAADAYRQAIKLAPQSPDAHLRLARAHYLLGDYAGARRELVEVEQLTGRADLLYLVALFHADLNQQAGDLRGAATEAERAVNLGRNYQSARIALAHFNDQLGMAERSRQIVHDLVQLPAAGDPWWEFRQPTMDAESLEWMRTYVRQ